MAEKPKTEAKKDTGKASKQGEDKVLIIPLRNKARRSAKNKRMNRSVSEIRRFLAKNMRTELSSIFISQQLNEFLWRRGFHNPPSKIKVKVSSDDEGKVFARLIDEKEIIAKAKKSKLGLRERLRRKASETPSDKESARKKDGADKKPADEKKSEKPAEAKPEEKPAAGKKPEVAKEKPSETKTEPKKETPPEEQVEQDILLEQ